MAIRELSNIIAAQIVSYDPAALDGMTVAELADCVSAELRDKDGVAYYCNYFDFVGNKALSDELVKIYSA